MDLLQLSWKQTRHIALLLGMSGVLFSCASSPKLSSTEEKTAPIAVVEVEKKEYRPLSAELVYYVLSAEIAGQRGQIGLASDLYDKASETIDSPALAGRSTQIANFTRDKKRINRALDRWLKVAPNDADVYIMRAPFLMMQSEYGQVVKSVDTALELAPEKSEEYLSKIADNLGELAQAEQALTTIQKLAFYKKGDPDALFVYARLAGHFKQYETALTTINAVLKQDSDREEAIVLKAKLLQRLGKGKEALATLKHIAKNTNSNDDSRFAYAKLLGENGMMSESYNAFKDLNEKHPNDEETLFALGLISLEEKKGDQAKGYFRQLVKLGDAGQQATYFMGLSEELDNNIDAALLWFISVPSTSTRFQAAQSRYINILADRGELNKARLHLKLLRKENPDRSLQYYLFEADFLRERKQFESAFTLYTEALTSHPGNIELLYGRAMVAEPLNRLSVLIDDFSQILEVAPNNHIVLNALGYTLTDRTEEHQRALTLIEKALVLKPNDPFYLDSLGWVYYRLNKLDNAERYLQQAVDLQDDSEFLAHLGEVLWQQGKHSQAKKTWQKGFEKDNNNVILNETMKRFNQ